MSFRGDDPAHFTTGISEVARWWALEEAAGEERGERSVLRIHEMGWNGMRWDGMG
jgi:hypothetical protein